jgi:electron transfer flavoprotein alpha subunit
MTRKEIWVVVERSEGEIEDVSLEIIGKLNVITKSSPYKIVAIVLGTSEERELQDIIRYGADKVILLKHERLNEYSNDLYSKALFDLASSEFPTALLIGATYYGRDLAGRLAARLRTGLTANAINLEMDEEGLLVFGVPAYGGKIMAEIICEKARPQMSTVRPGTFTKVYDQNRKGEIVEVVPDLSSVKDRVRVIERKVTKSKDLTKSERTIVGGNGIGGNISLVRKLAELTNSDVGVTRPLADKGIAPRELQVGTTGYSLKSKLTLILGVSGSEHFTSGIRDCRTVISVDIDRESEIFNHSDYCVVGDVSEIIPAVIKRLEEKR